jgi:CrcB protein
VKFFWPVAIGAALGGVARFYLGELIQNRTGAADFPVGTLVVNVTGSFLVGVVLRIAFRSGTMNEQLRIFLASGFCGGYTTFSTFSYETLTMIENGRAGRAAGYAGASLGLGLLATYAGFALADAILGH